LSLDTIGLANIRQTLSPLLPLSLSSVPLLQDADCWHEFLHTSVVTPIHVFEHTFLEALAAAAMPQPHHKGSAIARVHGIPEGGLAPPVVSKDFYERGRWTLVPPVSPPSLEWPATDTETSPTEKTKTASTPEDKE
jgi:hypothetical protein